MVSKILQTVSQNTKLLISIVSGLIALLSAIIASWQVVRATKIQSKTTIELEKIKIDNERKYLVLKETKNKISPIYKAIDTTWQQLQITKEELKKISSIGKYDLEVALNIILKTSEQLSAEYAIIGSQLDIITKKSMHKSKNMLICIAAQIESSIESQHSAISTYLEVTIEQLSEVQQILSTNRQQLLNKQFDEFIEILQ